MIGLIKLWEKNWGLIVIEFIQQKLTIIMAGSTPVRLEGRRTACTTQCTLGPKSSRFWPSWPWIPYPCPFWRRWGSSCRWYLFGSLRPCPQPSFQSAPFWVEAGPRRCFCHWSAWLGCTSTVASFPWLLVPSRSCVAPPASWSWLACRTVWPCRSLRDRSPLPFLPLAISRWSLFRSCCGRLFPPSFVPTSC